MTTSRNVGMKVGRGLGFVGATLWKGTVMVAGAAGEAGEGFMEGTEAGWEERCAVLDAKIEARRAKILAIKAAGNAAKELANAPAAMVAVAG